MAAQRAAGADGVNIRTKEKIQIPAQTGVRWSAGSAFKAAVDGRARTRTAGSQGSDTAERAVGKKDGPIAARLKGRTAPGR